MTTKNKVIILIVSHLLVLAVGRFTVPTKVVTETKVVEVEKKTKDLIKEIEKDKTKKIVIIDITRPDGTHETKTTITEREKSNSKKEKHETNDRSSSRETKKEIVRGDSPVTISALIGAPIDLSRGLGPYLIGGSVSRSILGPITLGVWGLSNATGGFSLGLTL